MQVSYNQMFAKCAAILNISLNPEAITFRKLDAQNNRAGDMQLGVSIQRHFALQFPYRLAGCLRLSAGEPICAASGTPAVKTVGATIVSDDARISS